MLKDSAIGLPSSKDTGIGDVASTLLSADVVESNGEIKTYCVVNEDGEFDVSFPGLLDSYGCQGIVVRMLLTLRPQIPITSTLKVIPFSKKKIQLKRLRTLLMKCGKNGNTFIFISTAKNRKGYVAVEE